ncbi:UvrD-helicase domain-containing protein [Parachitinimonas caeni]|uniref:DNA 3'-5' helicase II n=1 Tax=Parachitinimonas caeni TaxID=3031301 RepID=A0ABT7E0A2_9NEIS|nr:UvrD-helicase domain-containing protein [Parachitinimonas caeni]MDK2124332.1 UvrD-helicase domain-containing protein [Parachitinimonas caeni]
MESASTIGQGRIQLTDELAAILQWPQSTKAPRHLLIEALAGTGKTTALTALYDGLKRQGRQALALTFSRKGRRRFLGQYKTLFDASLNEQAAHALCNTFDEFAIRCLRVHSRVKRWEAGTLGRAIVDDDRPYLAMEQAVALINQHAQRHDMDPLPTDSESILALLELITNLKTSLTFTRAPFDAYNQEWADEFDRESIQLALQALKLPPWSFSLYQEYEKQRDAADFLCHGDAAYDLAQEPAAIRQYCQQQGIEYVLVDEFHDTKAVHFAILAEMAKAGCRLVAVGDRNQDIFEWRGATTFDAFEAYDQQLKQVGHLPLSITYRFGNPLAKTVKGVLERLRGNELSITPLRDSRTQFKQLSLKTQTPEDALISLISKGMSAGAAGKDFAILLPQPQMAFSLMVCLHRAKIGYRCDGITPLHLSREAGVLRAIVLLIDQKLQREYNHLDCMALLLLALSPRLKLSADDYRSLEALLSERALGERQIVYLPANLPLALEMLRARLAETGAPDESPSLRGWLQRFRIREWLGVMSPTQAAAQAMQVALGQLAAQIEREGSKAFLAELDELAKQFSKPNVGYASKVALTSVTHCKGNEWPYVILPASGHQSWAEHLLATASEQQKRELYVGLTRAQEGAWLLVP